FIKAIQFSYICKYLIRYMRTRDSLNQVALFHQNFNIPILETPQIPSKTRCELRVALLQEELNELKQAIEENDLTAVAGALCDLQYVLSGAALELGVGKKFATRFDEVQRANVAKACTDENQAQQTAEFYKTKGEDCFYRKSGPQYHVYRVADNK